MKSFALLLIIAASIGAAAFAGENDNIAQGGDEEMFELEFRRGGKDITSLNKEDLRSYRLAVDGIRGTEELNAICGDWSMSGFHSPEVGLAYLPWARRFLLRLEDLLGGPVPYWNFVDSDDEIPEIFLDESFSIDKAGNSKVNPLKSGLVPDGTETQRGSHWTVSISQCRGTLGYAVSRKDYEEFAEALLSTLNNVHYAVSWQRGANAYLLH